MKNSVFKNFKFDDDEVYDNAFKSDNEFSKIPKFIKNSEDRHKTLSLLRKHYGFI
jgi:hypothetical protein